MWHLGLSPVYAKVWAHTPALDFLGGSAAKGIQFDFVRTRTDQAAYEYAHTHYSSGFSLQVFSFDAPELGSSINGIYFIEPNLIHHPKFELKLRAGGGFNYASNPWHANNNPRNYAYSWHTSGCLVLGLRAGLQLNHFSRLTANVFYNHFSNGNTRNPNLGLNYPQFGLGYEVLINQRTSKMQKAQNAFKKYYAEVYGLVSNKSHPDTKTTEVKKAAFIQNVFTISKIAALLFVIIAGIFWISSSNEPVWTFKFSGFDLTTIGPGVFAAALVGSIFSSDAWNNITFTASEIEQPEKNLPRALLLGTSGVTLLYLASNLVYLKALSFDAIQHAESDRVGTLLMQTIFGETGAILMALLIMVSTFGCINGLTLSGARVYYAMAKDGYFLKQAAVLNKNQSPQAALIMQAVWACLLTLSGSYGDLLDYIM